MEITEVVTPSVAIPVLGVLVCAFLVFAFGFKSPGQPPSFDAFDEESKKKKNKRSKGKSQSNGHALTVPDEGNINTSAKPQQSPKQAKQTLKQATSTKVKQTAQVQEQPKKAKKLAVVKEVSKEQPVVSKQEPEALEDDDGWHTISKKDKKQKKKEERGETPIEEKYIAMEKQAVMEEPVTIVTEEKLEPPPASPQEQRQKKKKDKKAKKGKLELEVQEAIQDTIEMEPAKELAEEPAKEVAEEPAIDIEIVPVQTAAPQLEVVAENNVEQHLQDAMETHEVEAQVVKKKKNKKKKSSPAPETESTPAPVQPDPIPNQQEPPIIEPESQSSLSHIEEKTPMTAKSPKKKQKKDRSKANIEPKSADVDMGGASGSVEPSLSHSLTDVSKQSPKVITELSTDVVSGPTPGAEAAAPGQGPSFDELGGLSESWTEAKPKSKKKKARREN